MEWNGSGEITRTFFPETDRDNGVKILSSKFETYMASTAVVLENCYTLDAQTLPIADLDINNNKIENLTAGAVTKDAVNFGQLDAVDTKVDANTSLISGLSSAGLINGGVISNDAVTPASLIDITAVKARSLDDTVNINVDAVTDFDVTQSSSWASGATPSLTDSEVNVWADYNSGTPRYILDDASGSNISGAKRFIGAITTDGSGEIRAFTVPVNANTGTSQNNRQEYIYVDFVTESSNVSSQVITLTIPENSSLVDLQINMIGGGVTGTSVLDLDSVYGNWCRMQTQFEGADWTQASDVRDEMPVDSTKYLELVKSGVANTSGYVRNYGYTIER